MTPKARSMAAGEVALVLARPGEAALVVPLQAELQFGVRGEALRHVEIVNTKLAAGSDLTVSATTGAGMAYSLLTQEKYLGRTLLVRFAAQLGLASLSGRSGDLGFALAVIAAVARRADIPWPAMIATGELDPGGAVLPVEALAEKLAAAIDALPPGGFFLHPADIDEKLPAELIRDADARGIRLLAVHRFDQALRELGLPLSKSWAGSPFRGLEAFDVEHAAIFFGRDEEIEAICTLLSRRIAAGSPGLLIKGSSGAGKSSLARAGVVPALLRRGLPEIPSAQWRLAILTPAELLHDSRHDGQTDALWDVLASRLSQAWGRPDDAPAPAADAAQLSAGLAAASLRPLLLVDQLEQAFEAGTDPAWQSQLVEALSALHAGGTVLLATITRAGAAALSDHPRLAACFGVEGIFELEPRLGAARLQAIIERPAEAAGLAYEPGLAAELLTAASHGGEDVLPLLELLLTELYERRDRAGAVLRFDDYRALGGLDGVIAASLADIEKDLPSDDRPAIDRLLWKLATTRELVMADHAQDPALLNLIAALRNRRLVALDRRENGAEVAHAAHEALLRHWPYAASWRSRHGEDIALWRQLSIEARQWQAGQRSPIPLGPQLAKASSFVLQYHANWTGDDAGLLAYVRASERGQVTRRRAIGAGVALGASLAIGTGTYAWLHSGSPVNASGTAPNSTSPPDSLGTLKPSSVPAGPRVAVTPTASEDTASGSAAIAPASDAKQVTIRFDSVPIPGPDYVIAAAPVLRSYGIRVLSRDPDRAHLEIASTIGFYDGSAVDPVSGRHFLQIVANPGTAPISYSLGFDRPPRAIELVRSALWAATGSGVTHPKWRAEALDDQGQMVASSGEGLIGSYGNIPAKRIRLAIASSQTNGIAVLRVISDYRDGNGKPFAGSQGVLISEMRLFY